MSDVIDDDTIDDFATLKTTNDLVRRLACEVRRHRAAERERAKVPMPISRERLEFLRLGPAARKYHSSSPGLGDWAEVSSVEEERDLATFALAHMQQPLHSEAAKETEAPYTPPVFDNEIQELARRNYEDFVARREMMRGALPPAKETEPTFQGVPVGHARNLDRWLGDCEPPKSLQDEIASVEWTGGASEAAYYRKRASRLSRIDAERSKLLKAAQDDIAALRAEVERRDEIIACEVGLRKHAEANALEHEQAENVTFAYTHNMLDPTYHRLRTALLATVKGSSEVDTVRRAALALIQE